MKKELPTFKELTDKQQSILGLLKAHASNKQVADGLGITEGTLKQHLSILRKIYGMKRTQEIINHLFYKQSKN